MSNWSYSYHGDRDRDYEYDHEARVREVLGRKVAQLPFAQVVVLQEVAAALEIGTPLELVLTRIKLAPSNRDGVQVQPRNDVDADQIGRDKTKTRTWQRGQHG